MFLLGLRYLNDVLFCIKREKHNATANSQIASISGLLKTNLHKREWIHLDIHHNIFIFLTTQGDAACRW